MMQSVGEADSSKPGAKIALDAARLTRLGVQKHRLTLHTVKIDRAHRQNRPPDRPDWPRKPTGHMPVGKAWQGRTPTVCSRWARHRPADSSRNDAKIALHVDQPPLDAARLTPGRCPTDPQTRPSQTSTDASILPVQTNPPVAKAWQDNDGECDGPSCSNPAGTSCCVQLDRSPDGNRCVWLDVCRAWQ